jgi:hypothetical protein
MRRSGFIVLMLLAVSACTTGGEKKCVPSGCSGQLCTEEVGAPSAGTCEWSDSYHCFQTVGACERQTDGKCGWTPTDTLSNCLSKANSRPPFLPPSAP